MSSPQIKNLFNVFILHLDDIISPGQFHCHLVPALEATNNNRLICVYLNGRHVSTVQAVPGIIYKR